MIMSTQPVIEPEKRVTDLVLIRHLQRLGFDSSFVEFTQDYAPKNTVRRCSPYAKYYTDRISQAQFAVVSNLPMVKNGGHKVEAAWYESQKGWYSRANMFSAIVNGNRVAITNLYDQPNGTRFGEKLEYEPSVTIDGEILDCLSGPYILPQDPINENYELNTLEWDYGVCKRRLRLIEGRISGRWVFPVIPSGALTIKYNQQGHFRLRLSKFAVDDDSERITPDQLKALLALDLPLELGDSATFYPDASPETSSFDGYAQRIINPDRESWSSLVNSSGTNSADGTGIATGVNIGGTSASPYWWSLARNIFSFDTSSLGSVVVTAATLSTRAQNKVDEDGWLPDINVYDATPASQTGVSNSDYQTCGDTPFSSPIAYADWTIGDYEDFVLNAAGLAEISVVGNTTFSQRNANYDVAQTSPAIPLGADQVSHLRIYYSEQGAGYKPKLVITFTAISEPTVTTQAASEILETGATGNGNITDDGGDTVVERGFDIGTETGVYTDEQTETGSFSTGAFTLGLTGLEPNTTYYIRAKARNSKGWGYGDEVSFTTEYKIVTLPATEITEESASGSGYISSADITTVGIEWGTATGDYPNENTDDYDNSGPYWTLPMTSLPANTRIYYRAKALHAVDGWVYGDEVYFDTLKGAPVVATNAPTSATEETFVANGEITDVGFDAPDLRGIVYGTSSQTDPGDVAPASSGYDAYTSDPGTFATGTFSKLLHGLTTRSFYYYRAWAHNSQGYAYGSEVKVLVSDVINMLRPTGYIESNIRFVSGSFWPSSKLKWPRLLDQDAVYFTSAWGFGGVSGNYIYEKQHYAVNWFQDVYSLSQIHNQTEGIVKVKWKSHITGNSYPGTKYKRVIRVGGNNYSGSEAQSGPYTGVVCNVFRDSPDTSAAWTLAEANGMGAGVALYGGSGFGISVCDSLEIWLLWIDAAVQVTGINVIDGATLRLNGLVVEDEMETCQVHFEWGTISGALGNSTAAQTKARGETFYADIAASGIVFYRAVIVTACGETFYSAESSNTNTGKNQVIIIP
jgi:hypothetical protein